MEGCFRSTFPDKGWQAVRCGPPPKAIVGRKRTANGSGRTTATADQALVVGNGNDYAALSSRPTRSVVGSFPSVSGVTTGVVQYSLQINTDNDSNPAACAQFGFSSCKTWQQYVYSSDFDGDSSNGFQPVVFIESWVYATSSAEYKAVGCPSGWDAYDGNACVHNSDSVSAPLVPVSGIGSVKLTGSATSGGVDTATFSINGRAYSVSQAASTVHINKIWRKSEFNVFGNGARTQTVSFNRGSRVTVNVAVNDGTANAPACIGDSGETFEQNNLTLGSCTSFGGASPGISFPQSN
ncbi:hypothetical protein K6978_15895 [Xanthomonas cucurbitae]|uniref:Uncharacterized protein n=2 Tax=Xanthomonas TaxID=338 RepID=A0A2S7DUX5_9XANT|nr:hypothetical protein [Xanthomonas cucurbitae]PPU77628.1 hypothetical protein XcuCFBP2542_05210 [Xanthomonas cucurbitae]QHG88113.1 hypothetical protein EBN15_15360 [Xanthomonas cucurbitae]WDM69823.1 hypothetical protein K6981_15925 [Xanthomonas cucurbitae]WDM70849.1 hypothetical protein K6978_15895 [Xanthomonas cucurbitae]WDM77418.1 hypothetical protein K6982_14990 [Xanthomonas cucurbitae]